MKILSIETSCDETAIALLDVSGPLEQPDIKVLGNTLMSQVALHEQYGGVYPNLAKREHLKNLPILLAETLKQARVDTECPQLDFIAVTTGPGLEPALWTGITFAEELGKKWGKPVLPVNHMEGHVWSVLYKAENAVKLPALALLVSGGHTELVHVKDFGSYEIIGHTLDDAAGEAFDKVARMLGLHYPGGPKISALAAEARKKNQESGIKNQEGGFKFPRPMIHSGDLNFSFSGLKTAVLYKIKKDGREDESYKMAIALAFEDAVVEVLVEKTRNAIEKLSGAGRGVATLIIAGGVSANTHLIKSFETLIKDFSSASGRIVLQVPEKLLTTDNAIMIALASYVKVRSYPQVLSTDHKLEADGNLSISSPLQ